MINLPERNKEALLKKSGMTMEETEQFLEKKVKWELY